LGAQLCPRFIGRAPFHQGFGLRQKVGEQDGMVAAKRILGLHPCQKVTGDKLGTLVDELIEGVLPICAGLPPDDGSGGVLQGIACAADALTVAFHVALLEVSRKVFQILFVRQDGVRLRAEEVVVPDAQQRHQDGDVPGERLAAEVLVGRVRAAQEGFKVVHPDKKGDGKTDGGPERIAAAHPIPEFKHILGVDAKSPDCRRVGGHGGEVAGNVALIP